MTVKRPNSDEPIQFMDDELNGIAEEPSIAELDIPFPGEWRDGLDHEQQYEQPSDIWDTELADAAEPPTLSPGTQSISMFENDDADMEPVFIHPTPKARAAMQLGTGSSSDRQQVDPLVSRAINSLVHDRIVESAKQPSSFLDAMSFDSMFSMDRVWKMPQLPTYGRFEALSSAAMVSPSNIPETVTTAFEFRRKRLLATRFAMTDDQLEVNAMRKLREIVLFRPQDSRLGNALMDIAGKLVPEDVIRTSFMDSVAGKAPGTVAKRVADYHRYARWAVDNGKCGPMQISEPILYQYAQHLKSTGAAATSLQSFLKAIGFFEHLIGFVGSDVAFAVSGRVAGVSKTMLATKRELRQAPPITADDVYKLEKHVCNCSDKDACVGGFLLFTLFASARFADAARAHSVNLETAGHIALLESSTLKFKTANTAGREMKNVALPMLALGSGLHIDACWGERWIKARRAQGLEQFSVMMPAWSEISNTWIDRPMTSGEGIWYLREILTDAGVPEKQSMTYTTHSLKTTCLTWAATSGAMDIDQRRIMGHHFDSRLAMPLLYSRDALAEIQTKLWRILKAIRDGLFDPDPSRAQRIAAAARDWSDSESAGEIASDESCEPEELEPAENIPGMNKEEKERQMMSPADFEQCLQHVMSGVLHVKLDEDTLVCSRKISKNFSKPKCTYDEAGRFPFCRQCAIHVTG